MIDLLKEIAENQEIKIKLLKETKNRKGKKSKKQADDIVKEIVQYFTKNGIFRKNGQELLKNFI